MRSMPQENRFFSDDELSVVIFFQRGCLKQLRVTKAQRLSIAVAALTMAVLSCAALAFGLFTWKQNATLRSQLQLRSPGLFSYQVRYDQVFERSYATLPLTSAMPPQPGITDPVRPATEAFQVLDLNVDSDQDGQPSH